MCVVNFVFALSQLQGVKWMAWSAGTRRWTLPGFVGRGDSFLFVYFNFTCIGIPIYVVYFVCDSASEFGAMGSTSFLGFSYPNLLLVFLNLLSLGTCIICFSQVLDFLWVFSILFYFSVPYFGLACDHGNSFLCLEE